MRRRINQCRNRLFEVKRVKGCTGIPTFIAHATPTTVSVLTGIPDVPDDGVMETLGVFAVYTMPERRVLAACTR